MLYRLRHLLSEGGRHDPGKTRKLADKLCQSPGALGREVFMDATMRAGVSWLEEIDQLNKASNFMIVFCSRSQPIRRLCFQGMTKNGRWVPLRASQFIDARLRYAIRK